MNLRTAFILSLLLNIILISFFIGRRIYFANQTVEPEPKRQPHVYAVNRAEVFKAMPNDTGEIIFVGNSLTEGFPLHEIFKDQRIKNRGIAGNFSEDVIKRLDEITESNPAKIFLQIGINDIISGANTDKLLENFAYIISAIRKDSPNTLIYVQSLFPTSGIYESDNDAIRSYNKFLKNYCRENKLEFIDLYPVFEKDGLLDSSYTMDGLHLNGRGYLEWGQQLERIL